eukprot:TRINITY_DN22809_c0_g1_i1.p1 TRINITY_DN22809_c0_g1~~TRINITY_DN22809_c0_g1_i1.p1  ORF type:complete len:229 (+),score=51.77 TRINITY_DN22809_c0_g1_i1:62-748(+)
MCIRDRIMILKEDVSRRKAEMVELDYNIEQQIKVAAISKNMTGKQFQDMQKAYRELKKTVGESLKLIEELVDLKKQKVILQKDFITLKQSLLHGETQLINPPKSSKCGIISHVKDFLNEIAANYNKLHNLIKSRPDKVQVIAVEVFIKEATGKVNSKFNVLLQISLAFLNNIPRKLINSGIIDKSVVSILKEREGEIVAYKDCMAKYEVLINVVASKFSDCEQKLRSH